MMDIILKILLGAFVLFLIIVVFVALLAVLNGLYEDIQEGPLLHDIKTLIRKYCESSEQKGDDNEIIKD